MPPADLFALILAGVPAELVLGLGLHSIGPYANERATPGALTAADPGFGQAFELLLAAPAQRPPRRPAHRQRAGPRRHACASAAASRPTARREPAAVDARAAAGPRHVRGGLHACRAEARPDRHPHPLAGRGAEPARGRHRRARGRPRPTAAPTPACPTSPARPVPAGRGPVRVAPAARRVRRRLYDGDWFWIANDDLATKRVFSFVMLLLTSLSESSKPGQPPVISIPAG